jgi:glycosyltransferase involved in cell wall biosynthesis
LPNIAYITPLFFDEDSYLGGGERYPLNLAKAAAISGSHTVNLVSYGDVPEARTVPLVPGVTLSILPAASRRLGAEPLSWDVVDMVADADVVHIHQVFTRSGEVAMLAAKLAARPVCVTDHGGTSSTLGRSLGVLDLADRVIAYSRFGASLVSDTDAPVSVVAGGVDDRFFCPLSGERERDSVLFVGRLLPHKGVDRLIAAMPPDIQLIVCGQPYDPAYFALLERLAAGKQVQFVHDCDDERLRSLYRRALAVILPSVYVDYYGRSYGWPELMGLSLLEGMACGTPAICSRVGGMPEFVVDGETGFIYNELATLTDAIQKLADDRQLVDQMGHAGRELVERRFGLGPVGKKIRSIYDQMVAEPQ